MDRRFENVETDSTVDNTLGQMNTSDPDIEFRTHARARDAGQLLAGSAETMAVGPQTDMDARQAADPNIIGHLAVSFAPRSDLVATLPSAAAEASAAWRGTTHSTPYPTEVAYHGPHPSASGAVYAGQSNAMGSELGCFMGPSSSRPGVERVVVTNWGEFTPTTTGARTNTTATPISTYVTCSTVGGPVQAAYIGGPPPMGLTSVRPARQVFMPQPIEPSGSFPGVLAGPVGILRPPVRNMEDIWGEASTRSNLLPEFDASQVASKPVDRAVDPGASSECYLDNGSVSSSVTVTRAETYSQGSHGARPKTTTECQRMGSAGMETGSTGMQPAPGASVPSSRPAEVGHVMP